MSEVVHSQRSLTRANRLRAPFGARWSRLGLWIAAGLVAALLLLPPGYLLLRALGESQSAWKTLLRPQTIQILGRTLWLALTVTLTSVLIAVPLAWLTVRTDLPLRRMWAILTPLPLVIPSYVGAYLAVSALGPRGLLQQVLERAFGVERLPQIYGFPGALFVLTLMSYPYVLLTVRVALQHMDPALEEAARSLGKNGWATFSQITLRHLRPAIGAGSLLVALYTLRDFGAVSLLRYNTFTRSIYIQFNSFDRSSAATLALVLVALTFLILMFEARTRGRARYYQSGVGVVRPPTRFELGRWRWPATIFCGLIVLVSLILPAGVLLYWFVRGIESIDTVRALGLATWNSVLGSALAAIVTVVAALPIAILAVRAWSRRSQMLERVTYSAFALPGIVVALALVFFGANYALPLYQTLPMLLAAYAILFIPQALGTVRSSLLQVHPSLEETARSLGRNQWQVLMRVTIPLVRPGLLAGAALVFLTTMKELPATLLLAPLGFKTLSTSVWSAVSEAFFAQAAAPALLIMLVSSVPMALLIFREQ